MVPTISTPQFSCSCRVNLSIRSRLARNVEAATSECRDDAGPRHVVREDESLNAVAKPMTCEVSVPTIPSRRSAPDADVAVRGCKDGGDRERFHRPHAPKVRPDYIIQYSPSTLNRPLGSEPPHYDIIIIGTGAGGGTIAQALSRHIGAHSRSSSAATSFRRKRRTGIPRPCGSTCATAHERTLARRARQANSVLHALRRRRQHEVLGQRALSPAARGLSRRSSTSTACRRPGRSTTTRSRRTTTAPSACTRCEGGRASIPRSRRARRIRMPPCRTRRRWRPSSRSCARRAASIAAAARAPQARRGRRLHPVQHVQLVRVQDPREERGGCAAASGRRLHGRTSRSGRTRAPSG